MRSAVYSDIHLGLASGFADADFDYDSIASCPGEIVKNETYTQIRRIEFQGSQAYIKLVWGNPIVRLRSMMASDRGGREFRTLEACSRLGIHVPKPLARGVQRTAWGVVLGSFVVVEAFDGAEPLSDWLRARGAAAIDEPGFLALITELARQIRTIHASGIYFIRPTAKDILIRRRADDSGFEFLLLDLPTARRAAADWWVRIGQQRDIAALLATVHRHTGADLTETFLAGYLPDPRGKSREEMTAIIKEGIARRSRKRLSRRLKALTRRVRQ